MIRSRSSLVLVVLLLCGCDQTDPLADLHQYMQEVRARPKGKIEPLPTFSAYESFSYTASSLRSPFQTVAEEEVAQRKPINRSIVPDDKRPKSFLEGFNIDDFVMVGTLSNQQTHYALLRGAGGVHPVRIGDYIGRNYGRIVAIKNDHLEVIEIVPDGEGAWAERPQVLPLRQRP